MNSVSENVNLITTPNTVDNCFPTLGKYEKIGAFASSSLFFITIAACASRSLGWGETCPDGYYFTYSRVFSIFGLSALPISAAAIIYYGKRAFATEGQQNYIYRRIAVINAINLVVGGCLCGYVLVYSPAATC